MLKYFKLSPVAVAMHVLLSAGAAAAQNEPKADNSVSEVKFNTNFLKKESLAKLDLSRFEKGLPPSGTFTAELIVNGSSLGYADITVRDKYPERKADICLKKESFLILGIDTEKLFRDYPSKATLFKKESGCLSVNDLLPEGSLYFNSGNLALEITLPQKYMITRPRGYVNPEMWDKGVTAGIVGYSMNATRSVSQGSSYQTIYGNFNTGLNIDGWMLRHNGIYDKNSGSNGASYTALNTYVQRDLAAIGSRLTLGESNTKGELFDTLPFRGIQLANEEQMLPDTMRGYAPVVRGIARTTARVVISQSGRKIYEQTVPPGEFEITDLAPTGYGGDLTVLVEESDGSNSQFRVPYASVTNLLRPGTQHFSITAGEYHSDFLKKTPTLAEATYRRGLSNLFTVYGGIQGNTDYQAYLGGVAVGSILGAFSFDMTHAETRINENNHLSGQSFQAKYSHNFIQTGSNFSLAAYRFSTDGFMDYQTAMYAKEYFDKNDLRTAKSRVSVSANQSLGTGNGQFWVSAYKQDYWKQNETDIQYQLGYSNFFLRANYSLSMNRSRYSSGKNEDVFTLRVNIPLGDSYPVIDTIGASIRSGPNNALNQQITASGTGGDFKQYSYGISGSQSNQGGGNSASGNITARTPYTTVGVLGGTGKNYNTYSLSLSGAMVAHQGGLTLSPYNSDTYALVEAEGAQGARVTSYAGVKVDGKGYALVPYLSAYKMNEVEIDPRDTQGNVDFDITSQKVAPYSGAVVKLKYGTKSGMPLLINLTDKNSKKLPFGSSVFNSKGDNVGVIGQGGKAYLRVNEREGYLTVKWGESANERCKFSYVLPDMNKNIKKGFLKMASVCQ
ncbi:fimbria/pilus outer membrane usher protein [Enterobacter hormaechei]|uniref:fimbria/pilus outer membrane usher protein n=1 Tax=Enterobacter hormaechei TaxID=158836 RepID=UPI0026E3DAF6|nr:fimbria/pilus outer membrane usher protein [Enterobacter hormaechei]MDO6168688.1 fimbria/pilus outer membrane usher protein [Enterobacter hormaechei]MDO6172973.1 fimbria/pilus outer membrane usher protein [Enterobacter hormaechei]